MISHMTEIVRNKYVFLSSRITFAELSNPDVHSSNTPQFEAVVLVHESLYVVGRISAVVWIWVSEPVVVCYDAWLRPIGCLYQLLYVGSSCSE